MSDRVRHRSDPKITIEPVSDDDAPQDAAISIRSRMTIGVTLMSSYDVDQDRWTTRVVEVPNLVCVGVSRDASEMRACAWAIRHLSTKIERQAIAIEEKV